METPANLLVYRNNDIWTTLQAELAERVTLYYQDGKTRKGATVTQQIFPAGTTEAEIESWVKTNKKSIVTAVRVYCDGTSGRIIDATEVRKLSELFCIDKYLTEAIERVFRDVPLSEIYRKIFAKVTRCVGIKEIQIVLDAIADYNPLNIPLFKKHTNFEAPPRTKEIYAEEFCKLIPNGVKVSYVDNIYNLTLPNAETLVIVHHHALNKRKDSGDFHHSPRVLMTYPSGFVEKAAYLCDISTIVKGDVLETARKLITR